MSQPPAGQVHSPSAARSAKIRGAGPRTPVTLTIQFMSGAEPWVRVIHEGHEYRRPGTFYAWELPLWLLGWE